MWTPPCMYYPHFKMSQCMLYSTNPLVHVHIHNIEYIHICFTVVRCSALNNPDNGHVTVTSRVVGSTASYQCNRGYTLIGEEERVCLPDGSWSGYAPTCQGQYTMRVSLYLIREFIPLKVTVYN